MKKIIATIGPSASGKSTWAHKRFLESPETVRVVSYDNIRMLLFGFTEANLATYYEMPNMRKLEKAVQTQAHNIIYDLLETRGVGEIILDATNLKEEYLMNLRYWNIPIELKVFNTNRESLYDRDGLRTKRVGPDVIGRQHQQFSSLINKLPDISSKIQPVEFVNEGEKRCVIFDIDGTLAHNQGRSPFDWKRVSEDDYDHPTFEIFHSLSHYDPNSHEPEPPKVFVCTGRESTSREETLNWFEGQGVYLDPQDIFFRRFSDNRPDWVVKEEMWRKINSRGYEIVGMFDDRNSVVRRARRLGLKVFHVEHNNF